MNFDSIFLHLRNEKRPTVGLSSFNYNNNNNNNNNNNFIKQD